MWEIFALMYLVGVVSFLILNHAYNKLREDDDKMREELDKKDDNDT